MGIKKVIFIIGPTAAGKSDLALKLAKKLGGEIISADSMQVYRGMDIGTAKPSREELKEVKHYLIDSIMPDEPWSVSDFIDNVRDLTKMIVKKSKIPIIVGGTGLYINSLLEGYSFPVIRKDEKIRRMLEEEAGLYGSAMLHERLKDIDRTAAENIHPNDKKRIIRALEVYEITGKPISKLREKGKSVLPYPAVLIGLKMDREKLYKRIDSRIDGMLERGLIEEVRKLIKKGYDRSFTSMEAIGYKEVIGYIRGECSYDEMAEKLKRNTRNFAKRQMTWFKRFKNVEWFDVEKLKLNDIINAIKEG